MTEHNDRSAATGYGPLLPCPFCGGSATMEQTTDNRWSVGCDSADEPTCMGYQNFTTFARRGEAREAWNKRTGAPAQPTLEPCCPFCERDPFHYVDIGVGMEPAAVVCCDLGDLYFRGAREAPEEVTMSWEDFTKIGSRLAAQPPAAPVETEVRGQAHRDAISPSGGKMFNAHNGSSADTAHVVSRCMDILEDVPGENLIDRVNRLLDWHQMLTNNYHDDLAKARSRAEPQSSGVWQPIETAPKGAEATFLVCAVGDARGPFVVRSDILWQARKAGTPSHLGLSYLTHWMPLPEMPQ